MSAAKRPEETKAAKVQTFLAQFREAEKRLGELTAYCNALKFAKQFAAKVIGEIESGLNDDPELHDAHHGIGGYARSTTEIESNINAIERVLLVSQSRLQQMEPMHRRLSQQPNARVPVADIEQGTDDLSAIKTNLDELFTPTVDPFFSMFREATGNTLPSDDEF